MKNKEIVASELTAPLEAYFKKESEVDFEMMADALEELSAMYRRKMLFEKNRKN
jgi:hypothetical protein